MKTMDPTPLTLIQQSRLDNLVNSGKLHQVPIDYSKAKRFIEQATQSLMELPSIRTNQLRYDGGYNAAHDIGEAILAAYGFRTANGSGQHVSLGEAMTIIFDGTAANDAAEEFESLRKVRNQSRYFASPIGNSQADQAIICASELLAQVQKSLNYRNHEID